MQIREATHADADRIADLLTQLDYPSTTDEVRHRLVDFDADPFSRVLLADDAGWVLGCLTLHASPSLVRTGRSARILSLVIDASARRTGLGRQLVATAIKIATEWGCYRIEVTSARRRIGAHAFYRRLGFVDTCPDSGRFLLAIG